MRLPDDSIGISDLLAKRDCGRRMSYSMRRHTGRGSQSDARTPEAQSPAAAYGSCIHDVIHHVEEGRSDDEAVNAAWAVWHQWLVPQDLDLLRLDLDTYRRRDFPGTRTVMNEDELRVPLMEHEGRTIFFRGRIDRLYERLDAPGTFIHVDYKSSRHAKSEKDVHNDLQLWAYNWSIFEFYPEVDRLLQVHDQLRYGQVSTRKSDDQRRQIKAWLVEEVTALLADDDVQDDGLLKPSFNEWCPWCPLLESCPIPGELSQFALGRIATLAPQRPKIKKDGGDSKVMERAPLDAAMIDEYVAALQEIGRGRQVLERFEKSVKDLLRDMTPTQVAALGYELKERGSSVFTAEAKRHLAEVLGATWWDVASVSKTSLERELVDDPDRLAWALSLAERVAGTTTTVVKVAD